MSVLQEQIIKLLVFLKTFLNLGNCTAGQYCQGGAASPVPDDSNVDYPENGPCIVGHYCPEGTLVPVECEVGTLRNITGMVLSSFRIYYKTFINVYNYIVCNMSKFS